jgi:hypothetical protein
MSVREVVRRTRAFVARRRTSPTNPTTQTAPATAPAIAENQRYVFSDMPIASVNEDGIMSPITCPPTAASAP